MPEPRKTSFLRQHITRMDAVCVGLFLILMDALEAAIGETATIALAAICFVALLVLIWLLRQRRGGDAC